MKSQSYDIKLAQNEFLNKDDYIGFWQREPEPINFLSVDSYDWQQEDIDSDMRLSLYMRLSANKNVYERSVYTVFTLIGDIGGFNAAIVILPTFLMAFYSERMYQGSI